MQKRPHGDVERWLEDNLEEEQGPVSHAEQPDKDVQSTATPLSAAPDEDNLVQLPAGATFGSGHEPSPQEREELLRFAAAADAELSAGDEGGHAESEPRRPEQDGDAGQ